MNKEIKTKKPREPLFHVIKRSTIPTWKSIGIRLLAILAAIAVCSIFVYIAGNVNPVEYFKSMFKGAFGTTKLIWSFAYESALLLCFAVAVTPAFKMRFWNIGAEGQVLMGALAASAVMFYLGGKISNIALWIIMIAASIFMSALWAFIPAFCKAKWNTNETLFTLMMNYIAIQIIAFCIDSWVKDGSGILKPMHEYGFPTIYNKWLLNIIIIVVITAFMYVYLKYSKHGYEIAVVGESENTARYIGINVKKVIIRTLILSGVLCGIAGLIISGGMNHTVSETSAGGKGFTAILVSWLAKFNPLTMVLTSLLIIFFKVGALQVRTDFHLDDISDIATAIILFFIIGCEFFINYKIVFRKSHKEVK